MNGNTRWIVGAAALLTAVALAVAAASTTPAAGPRAANVAHASTLSARASRYGKILFDGRGRVLYLFARDPRGRSSCYGACAKAWPPFLTNGVPKSLAGVNPKLLGTAKRTGGSLQVTYAKHPLYYFSKDNKPGQLTCQNVANVRGLWLHV